MIRRSGLNLSNANQGKLATLDRFMDEAMRVVNLYIDKLWSDSDFSSKFVNFKVDTWLSARMQQCLGKQALEMVKSQRKKKKRTKPVFNGNTINLDSRFIGFKETGNSFDMWLKLSSIGSRTIIKLPTNKHYHFNRFDGWAMKQSIRLSRSHGYMVDVFFEKDAPAPKCSTRPLAIDIGYKKLIVTSENQRLGDDSIYEKISRKKQGSKAFKRALRERDDAINVACKQLPIDDIGVIYAEDLKSVKTGSKGKFRKRFNNKLQRWSYPKVLDKLSTLCEESGVQLIKVPPQYTSQRCSTCGVSTAVKYGPDALHPFH